MTIYTKTMRDWNNVFDYSVKPSEKIVKGECLDYCVKLDNERVKLSWLALHDIRDLTDFFLKELEGKFVDDLSYYLARDAMNHPVSKSEAKMCNKILNDKMEKVHRRRLKQMSRRKAKKQDKQLKKQQGQFTIDFGTTNNKS